MTSIDDVMREWDDKIDKKLEDAKGVHAAVDGMEQDKKGNGAQGAPATVTAADQHPAAAADQQSTLVVGLPPSRHALYIELVHLIDQDIEVAARAYIEPGHKKPMLFRRLAPGDYQINVYQRARNVKIGLKAGKNVADLRRTRR